MKAFSCVGRRLGRCRLLPQFLLEVLDLVAQARRELEAEVLGRLLHLLVEFRDQPRRSPVALPAISSRVWGTGVALR